MRKLNILIIDDDEIFQELFCEVLDVIGYQNVTCISIAQDALEHLLQNETYYDCIFLDINMPGIDGIDLCQRIHRIKRHQSAYIIMVSGQSDRTTINDAFLAGAMDYITKPFDPFEIRSRLRIAQRLIFERQENLNKALVIDLLQEKLKSNDRHVASDRAMIDDIDGFLDYVDFENKLLRSKRSTLVKSQVFSIFVSDLVPIIRATTDIGFHSAITKIAGKIAEATMLFQRTLTYVGNGVFICLSNDAAIGDSVEPILSVLETIREFEIKLNDGSYVSVELDISSPVRSKKLFSDSPIKLIYSALASVPIEREVDGEHKEISRKYDTDQPSSSGFLA